MEAQEIECPRCHEQCGWCADYRWMHGTIRLPNLSGRKNTHCTIPEFAPEGDKCPICAGSMKVLATTTYVPATNRTAPQNQHWMKEQA